MRARARRERGALGGGGGLGARAAPYLRRRAAAAASLGRDEGYVITVLRIEDRHISEGRLDALTGFAVFTVQFSAIMCRPFKAEVLDVVAVSVERSGLMCNAGPVQIVINEIVRARACGGGGGGCVAALRCDVEDGARTAMRVCLRYRTWVAVGALTTA